MLKQKLFFIFTLFLLVGATAVRAQSMTDDQVLQYVKDGMQQGKDQRQMATELARRGVTRAQAERVKKLYESQNPSGESTMGTVAAEDRLREQVREDSVLVQPRQTEEVTADQVFGRNIFNTRNLTFEPSVNLATPPGRRGHHRHLGSEPEQYPEHHLAGWLYQHPKHRIGLPERHDRGGSQ